jgi:hypothetical protein
MASRCDAETIYRGKAKGGSLLQLVPERFPLPVFCPGSSFRDAESVNSHPKACAEYSPHWAGLVRRSEAPQSPSLPLPIRLQWWGAGSSRSHLNW